MSSQDVPQIPEGELQLGPLLGWGGQGEVFRGTWRKRRVAVKKLNVVVNDGDPNSAHCNILTERVRELQRMAVAAMRCNRVCRLLGYSIIDTRLHIVMPLYERGSLAARIAERGALHGDELVSVAERLLESLKELHDCGIVHRDVKPANVLLDDDGKLLLADFGLAVVVETMNSTGTTTDKLFGTAHYASPEQLYSRPCTPASDAFALACTMYHVATGQRPHASLTPFEVGVVVAIEHRFPEIPDAVPEPLRSALQGALRAEPEERTSVEDMLRAAREARVRDCSLCRAGREAGTMVACSEGRHRLCGDCLASVVRAVTADPGVFTDEGHLPCARCAATECDGVFPEDTVVFQLGSEDVRRCFLDAIRRHAALMAGRTRAPPAGAVGHEGTAGQRGEVEESAMEVEQGDVVGQERGPEGVEHVRAALQDMVAEQDCVVGQQGGSEEHEGLEQHEGVPEEPREAPQPSADEHSFPGDGTTPDELGDSLPVPSGHGTWDSDRPSTRPVATWVDVPSEAGADDGSVHQHRQALEDELLVTRCPSCLNPGLAGGDLHECMVLWCAQEDGGCGTAMCGWCFGNCGEDVIRHVATCAFNPRAPYVTGSERELLARVQAEQRRRVVEYLREMVPPAMREAVWGAVEGLPVLRDAGLRWAQVAEDLQSSWCASLDTPGSGSTIPQPWAEGSRGRTHAAPAPVQVLSSDGGFSDGPPSTLGTASGDPLQDLAEVGQLTGLLGRMGPAGTSHAVRSALDLRNEPRGKRKPLVGEGGKAMLAMGALLTGGTVLGAVLDGPTSALSALSPTRAPAKAPPAPDPPSPSPPPPPPPLPKAMQLALAAQQGGSVDLENSEVELGAELRVVGYMVVSNGTVRVPGGAPYAFTVPPGGRLELTSVQVVGAGVWCVGGCAMLCNSLVKAAPETGVLCTTSGIAAILPAWAHLNGVTVEGAGADGIACVGGGCAVTLDGPCAVLGSGGHGLVCRGGARIVAEGVQVRKAFLSGVFCEGEKSDMALTGASVGPAREHGVECATGGRVSAVETVLMGFRLCGAVAWQGGVLAMRGVRVEGSQCAHHGVFCSEGGRAEVHGGCIRDCGKIGVHCKGESSSVTVTDGLVTGCREGSGVACWERGSVELRATHVLDCRHSGVLVRDRGSVVTVAGGVVQNAREHGVECLAGGEARLDDVRVRECGLCGIASRGRGSRVTVTGGVIEEVREHHGVACAQGGHVKVRGVTIRQCRQFGVLQGDLGSSAHVVGCTITDCGEGAQFVSSGCNVD